MKCLQLSIMRNNLLIRIRLAILAQIFIVKKSSTNTKFHLLCIINLMSLSTCCIFLLPDFLITDFSLKTTALEMFLCFICLLFDLIVTDLHVPNVCIKNLD